MPTTCSHYAHLASRFEQLCGKFLESEIASETADPVGFSADLDKLAAFRLLFHAEVETFLEEKAKEALLKLESDISTGRWHHNNPHLLSLYLVVGKCIPERDDLVDADLRAHFSQVITTARTKIKENNGIRAQSFAFLSVAAGKTMDDLDATLSAMLHSYGKDRGEVAHGSAARSRTLSAPSAERFAASAIFTQIGSYFDVVR
jgi:hypothetical protein